MRGGLRGSVESQLCQARAQTRGTAQRCRARGRARCRSGWRGRTCAWARSASSRSRGAVGPCAAEAKAVACQNARSHGLLARQVLLPDENRARLIALREHFLAELAPVGELETLLVDHMVACTWRLRRLHAVEAGVFQGARDDDTWGPHGALGFAFHQATETFAKLARYEAALERAFYRALHELQR